MSKRISLGALSVAIGTLLAPQALAVELNTEYDKGYLIFSAPDGSYQMKLDGRIMLDTGVVSTDLNDFEANTEFRRARLAFKTMYDGKWAGELDLDFAENEPELKDAWVSYIAIPHTTLKIGNHKPFWSMAETTTSRWYTFMEAPMVVDAFAPSRRIGISASYWQDRYFVGATILGDEVAVNNTDEEQGESFGFAARGLYRPWLENDGQRFLHVGFDYLNVAPQSDDSDKVRFRSRAETRVADYKLLNTGKMSDADNTTIYGVEIAGRYDKWMLQGEYHTAKVSRDNGQPDYEADGYYLETSYMLFGNGRNYNLDDGEFGPVRPTGEHGDLELALRYSHLDLNDADADIYGGSADNITIGVNWYAHSNVIFRFNYTITDLDEHADGDGDYVGGDDMNVAAMRVEYLF